MTPVWAGEISCRYLGAAVEAFDPLGRSLVGTQGELVVTEPMPSMPVGFWGDSDGSKYRSTYFDRFSKVWTHGDWITLTSRGSAVISGRSDATLNRAGIRVGTAEIYSALEAIEEVVDSLIVHVSEVDGNDKLVLFVHTDDQRASQPNRDALAPMIRETIRQQVSPRHVPDEIHFVSAIPKTLSGKKPEIPIKRILMGAEPETAISRESLEDPGALDAIIQIAAIRQSSTETT
jgi:acetoacetyl-CoA synthetase